MSGSVGLFEEQAQRVMDALDSSRDRRRIFREFVEETRQLIVELERVPSSHLEKLEDLSEHCVRIQNMELSEPVKHISQVLTEFQQTAGTSNNIYLGQLDTPQRIQVLPFVKGGSLNIEQIRQHFRHDGVNAYAGYVYLYFAPSLGRILVSVNGHNFIGMISTQRTWEILAIMARTKGNIIQLRAQLTGARLLIGG